jgi:Domain of unknown function (DUF932)
MALYHYIDLYNTYWLEDLMVKNKNQELDDEFVSYSGNQIPSKLKDISFEFDEKSKKDLGFGHSTMNLLLLDNTKHEVYDPRELKGIFIDGYYKTLATRHYAVVPDPLLESYIQPIIDSGDIKYLDKTYSSNGLVTSWKYEVKKDFVVKKENKQKDDRYGVQVVFRNSLNGGVALSAAVRTLRLVCGNGLMMWGTEFSHKIAHYGDDLTEKLADFKSRFHKVISTTDKAIALLERTTEIHASQAHMQYLLSKVNVTEHYIPDYIKLEKNKRKIAVVGKEGKDKTLYEVLNDFTWKISRADPKHPEHNKVKGELSFLGMTVREQQLNRAVHKIVVQNGKVPSS